MTGNQIFRYVHLLDRRLTILTGSMPWKPGDNLEPADALELAEMEWELQKFRGLASQEWETLETEETPETAHPC